MHCSVIVWYFAIFNLVLNEISWAYRKVTPVTACSLYKGSEVMHNLWYLDHHLSYNQGLSLYTELFCLWLPSVTIAAGLAKWWHECFAIVCALQRRWNKAEAVFNGLMTKRRKRKKWCCLVHGCTVPQGLARRWWPTFALTMMIKIALWISLMNCLVLVQDIALCILSLPKVGNSVCHYRYGDAAIIPLCAKPRWWGGVL